jgi:hypothetical protein
LHAFHAGAFAVHAIEDLPDRRHVAVVRSPGSRIAQIHSGESGERGAEEKGREAEEGFDFHTPAVEKPLRVVTGRPEIFSRETTKIVSLPLRAGAHDMRAKHNYLANVINFA